MTELIEPLLNSYDGYDFDGHAAPDDDHVDAASAKNIVLIPEPTRELLNERQRVGPATTVSSLSRGC